MYPAQNNSSFKLHFITIAISAFFIILFIIYRKFSLGRLVPGNQSATSESAESSAIISFYTAGHNITRGDRGKLDGMTYSLYVTSSQAPGTTNSLPFVEENVVLYALDLPFNTESHFIGLSKDHVIDRIQIESFLQANNMEKVILEGDFPNYFDIYAAKGQQFEVRTVLEPDAMNFVVEYCRSHFWEINNSEMYFVDQESDNSNPNSMPLLEQSTNFVSAIKPALLPGQAGAPIVHHEVPYGEYDGPALPCPLCSKTMTLHDSWQACPDGQGILISGRDLVAMHNGNLQIDAALANKDTMHDKLTCPNCHNLMTSTPFEGNSIIIDSCEHCPFRWLDASEVIQLKHS